MKAQSSSSHNNFIKANGPYRMFIAGTSLVGNLKEEVITGNKSIRSSNIFSAEKHSSQAIAATINSKESVDATTEVVTIMDNIFADNR